MNTPTFTGSSHVVKREARAKRRDFYRRYDLLLSNWYLLTNRIQQEIEAVREDLHQDLACWRPHHPEPDWSAYADRMSMICRQGGIRPALGLTN
jgi:hypothetical protein